VAVAAIAVATPKLWNQPLLDSEIVATEPVISGFDFKIKMQELILIILLGNM